MNIVDFAMIVVAAWYVQHLAAIESGPWGAFDWVREHIFGVEIVGGFSDGYRPKVLRPGILADLITCIYCRSFWVFLGMAGLFFLWKPIILPFAGAAMVVLIEKVVKRGTG